MNTGKLTYVNGDATEPQKEKDDEIVIIAHCCNTLGAWGAGFVVALSKKWKQPEEAYHNFIEMYKERRLPTLGKVSYAKIDNHLVVANMIGQEGVRGPKNHKPVKYTALADAMREVVGYIDMILNQVSAPVVVHCPKFGSDLAGGDWRIIEELIKEIWVDAGIDVKVYNFVPAGHTPKPLYRTDITIWTDGDSFQTYPDLPTLARAAVDGDAYCTRQECTKVDDIFVYARDYYDGLNGFFFGADE